MMNHLDFPLATASAANTPFTFGGLSEFSTGQPQHFEAFDFSIKAMDSFDIFSQLPAPSGLPFTRNMSLYSLQQANNNNQQQQQPDLPQSFARQNFSFEPQLNNNNNPFSMSAVNSLGMLNNNTNIDFSFRTLHNNNNNAQMEEGDSDSYDFMNLNQITNDHHHHLNQDNSHMNSNNQLNCSNIHFNGFKNELNQQQQIQNHSTHGTQTEFNPFENLKTLTHSNNNNNNNNCMFASNSISGTTAASREAQLLRMSDFEQKLPEMEFDPFSEEEQAMMMKNNNNNNGNFDSTNNLCKSRGNGCDKFGSSFESATSKVIEKQKRRDYDKNICRYIARQMMRCFISEEYRAIVLTRFCSNDTEALENTIELIKKTLPVISGHRTFKNFLTIERDEEHTPIQTYKNIFRQYAKWFLKERSLRYIVLGNSEDKTQYIRFKNQVMLYFVKRPEKWNANLKIIPTAFKVRSVQPVAVTTATTTTTATTSPQVPTAPAPISHNFDSYSSHLSPFDTLSDQAHDLF